MNTNHLYFHYPFCKKKCSYCDFISFPKHEEFVEKYHTALCNEIKAFAQAQPKGKIKTMFFGGGTPSLYPLNLFEELFELLNKNFSLENLEEVTIEVNPGDVENKHLTTYKKLGINRLSIGVQTLDEKILQNVNRMQTNHDVEKILQLAPKQFDNISVDLILGLPGITTKTWFDTLDYITSRPITHISIYFLTLYKKTPLYFKVKSGRVKLPNEAWLIDTYTKTIDYLETKKIFQYEISNFAKQGCESIHNKAYWDRKPYHGFGLSAASFDEKKRLVNSNNLVEYLHCWKDSRNCKNDSFWQETLTPENVLLEELMLGLRQKKGIDLQRMVYYLSEVLKASPRLFEKKVDKLKKENLIEEKNGRIFLTTRGMVLENGVIISLLEG